MKKIIIFLPILVLLFLTIIRIINISKVPKSNEEVKDYLEKHLKEKYNKDFTLSFISKEEVKECTFWLDGCIKEKTYKGVYEFIFNGHDQEGNSFQIKYRNFKNKERIKNPYIVDDYDKYSKRENIKKLLNNKYKSYELYFNMEDNYFHILIYEENLDSNKLVNLTKELSDISYNYTIMLINKEVVYNKLLYTKYRLKNKNTWEYGNETIIKSLNATKLNELKFLSGKEEEIKNLDFSQANLVLLLYAHNSIILYK